MKWVKSVLLIIIFFNLMSKQNNENKISNFKFKTLYFDYYKPSVVNTKDLKENIQNMKLILSKNPETKFIIEGHAALDFDEPLGKKEERYLTSYIRSNAVINELLKHKIPAENIKILPLGNRNSKTIPLPDEDELSFSKRAAKDRRVEIKIFTPEEFQNVNNIAGLYF
jgi:outer membrane protein OmpA-like peptidoglycan-associated protein